MRSLSIYTSFLNAFPYKIFLLLKSTFFFKLSLCHYLPCTALMRPTYVMSLLPPLLSVSWICNHFRELTSSPPINNGPHCTDSQVSDGLILFSEQEEVVRQQRYMVTKVWHQPNENGLTQTDTTFHKYPRSLSWAVTKLQSAVCSVFLHYLNWVMLLGFARELLLNDWSKRDELFLISVQVVFHGWTFDLKLGSPHFLQLLGLVR